MEKIKEYGGVPKKYIWITAVFCLVFIVAIPVPMISNFGLYCLIFISSFVLLTIVHELLHGVCFKVFTGHVTFGAVMKWKVIPYAFYASAPQEKLSRNKFMIVGLFPQILAIPCLLVVALNHNLFVEYISLMVMAANLTGGVSDWWAVMTLGKYSKDVLVEDTKTGMVIYQKV